MNARPVFLDAPARAGMYESFYLRACSPSRPQGVWIRHTVHKRPGAQPRGSIWCTVFDAQRGAPFMHKVSSDRLSAIPGGWISIADEATMGPREAAGACGEASWALRYCGAESELRHLSPELLYRAPLPRTKLTSPLPAASFDGTLRLPDRGEIGLAGWPGMVGHNWGAEHAERWIWLHGVAFEGEPRAWLDVALGRVRIAGRLTPWVANGALALDGARHRLGGLRARRPEVQEGVDGCRLTLFGGGGLEVEATVGVPAGAAAGWRYADPDGGEHDVVNCSVAALELNVRTGAGAARRVLSSAHGGAYELGMRERDHGVAIAPFADG